MTFRRTVRTPGGGMLHKNVFLLSRIPSQSKQGLVTLYGASSDYVTDLASTEAPGSCRQSSCRSSTQSSWRSGPGGRATESCRLGSGPRLAVSGVTRAGPVANTFRAVTVVTAVECITDGLTELLDQGFAALCHRRPSTELLDQGFAALRHRRPSTELLDQGFAALCPYGLAQSCQTRATLPCVTDGLAQSCQTRATLPCVTDGLAQSC